MVTNQRTVLIIEDNPDLQIIYKIHFENYGYRVESATDGLQGITDIVGKEPDVVLLDIMMPKMDGYEVLEGLRHNSSIDVPVIVCSNLSQKEDIKKVYASGADLYLRKSDYEGEDLVEKVSEFLETHS